MDTRQLRYFTAIFEAGALSRAAERLHIAPSALSHHLGNLEADLGSALFERKARGMSPTAAGVRLYEHATAILHAMSLAEQDLRDQGGQISGQISISMATSAVKAFGVDLVTTVVQQYPHLQLSLSEHLSTTAIHELLDRKCDLAVVFNPPPDPRLNARVILEEEIFCVGRPELLGATDAPIHLRDAMDLPLIMLRDSRSARAIIDDPGLTRQLEERAQLRMNSVHAISECVRRGLGCILGTRLMFQDIGAPGLIYRPIADTGMVRRFCLCELADAVPTFARSHLCTLILELSRAGVRGGKWPNTRLIDPA